MRKIFNFLLLTLFISPVCFIIGCDVDKNEQKVDEVDDLSTLYQNYISYSQKNESEPKSYNEFLSFVENKGEQSGKVNENSHIIDSGEQSIQAKNVENCQNGKSAYEIAVENGFNGTISEWLESLKGDNGQNGLNGLDGRNGINGKDGQNGIGISNTTIDVEGHLIVTFTDGDTKDCGKVVGENGSDGKDGENGKDGQKGERGEKGEKGDIGDSGEQGIQGVQGEQGVKGEDGQAGVGIERIEKVGSNENVDIYEIILTNGQQYPFSITNAKENIIETEQIDEGATQNLHYVYNKYQKFYQVAGIGLASDMDIVVSASFMGKEVLSIMENAFCNVSYIASVKINKGIQVIEDNAFSNCYGLQEVTIPLSVTSISTCAFDRCDLLNKIIIEIGENEYKTYSSFQQVKQDTTNFNIESGLIVRK